MLGGLARAVGREWGGKVAVAVAEDRARAALEVERIVVEA